MRRSLYRFFQRLNMQTLTGNEPSTYDGLPVGIPLNAFWAWNSSDFLNNTLRCALAEFLVGSALGMTSPCTARIGPPMTCFLCPERKLRLKVPHICKAGIRNAFLTFSSAYGRHAHGVQKMVSAQTWSAGSSMYSQPLLWTVAAKHKKSLRSTPCLASYRLRPPIKIYRIPWRTSDKQRFPTQKREEGNSGVLRVFLRVHSIPWSRDITKRYFQKRQP